MTELTQRMHTMVEEGADTMIALPRQLILASRGAICMTRDEAGRLLAHGEDLFQRLVERGRKMEIPAPAVRQESWRWLKAWEKRSRKQLHQAEEQIEQQIQDVLRALHIPSAEDVEQLDKELDRLSAKIDRYLAQMEKARLPIEGYDELTVKEIVPLLDNLDEAGLKMIQVYEQANANRVTVLRAIEDKLAA